jgi:hypothetical protein
MAVCDEIPIGQQPFDIAAEVILSGLFEIALEGGEIEILDRQVIIEALRRLKEAEELLA